MLRFPCPEKVLHIITRGEYTSPDAYDDLPRIIEWATGCLTDPYMPRKYADDMKRMLTEAHAELERIRGCAG